jgi:hypothetical protein
MLEDLPSMWELVEPTRNPHTPVVDWNTKVLYCQIQQVWYNNDIDSLNTEKIDD